MVVLLQGKLIASEASEQPILFCRQSVFPRLCSPTESGLLDVLDTLTDLRLVHRTTSDMFMFLCRSKALRSTMDWRFRDQSSIYSSPRTPLTGAFVSGTMLNVPRCVSGDSQQEWQFRHFRSWNPKRSLCFRQVSASFSILGEEDEEGSR